MPSLFVNYLLLWTHQPRVWQTQGFSHLEARRMCSPCLRWPLTMKITHWLCPKRFASQAKELRNLFFTSLLGKRKWEARLRRRGQFHSSTQASFDTPIALPGVISRRPQPPQKHAAAMTTHTPPEKPPVVSLPICPCFSDALLSPARRLCSNCVLFLPLLHAANPGDEQFRGVWVWWSWP